LLVRTEGRAQATSCFEPISVWHLELVELTLIDGDATAAELGSESEKWARSEAVIDVYSEDRAALSARGGEVISLEAVP
jgi:hypothetical protein